MKKRTILSLAVVAVLTACGGGNRDTSPNTTVNLPNGGSKVAVEQQADAIDALSAGLTNSMDLENIVVAPDEGGEDVNYRGGVSMSASLIFDVALKLKIEDHQEPTTENPGYFYDIRTNFDIQTSGSLIANYYDANQLVLKELFKESEESSEELPYPLWASYAGFELHDFTLKGSYSHYEYDSYMRMMELDPIDVSVNFNISGVDLSIYYAYEAITNRGFIFIDVSDEELAAYIEDIVNAALIMIPEEEDMVYVEEETRTSPLPSEDVEEATIASSIKEFVGEHGKMAIPLDEVAELLDRIVANNDDLTEEEAKSYTEAAELLRTNLLHSSDEVLDKLSDMEELEGAFGYLEMFDYISFVIPMLAALNPTLVNYSNPELGIAQLGIGVNVDDTNQTFQSLLGTFMHNASENPFRVKLGLALVVGNTKGSDEMKVEFLEVKAYLASKTNPNDLMVNASISLAMDYHSLMGTNPVELREYEEMNVDELYAFISAIQELYEEETK